MIARNAQTTVETGQNRQKIVIPTSDSDPARWSLALNSAKNLQEDVGTANVDVETVAEATGVGMLRLVSPVRGLPGQTSELKGNRGPQVNLRVTAIGHETFLNDRRAHATAAAATQLESCD